LALVFESSARNLPTLRQYNEVRLANGQEAILLNEKFKTLKADSSCNDGDMACVEGKLARCSGGNFLLKDCAPGTICSALPLEISSGTSVACATQSNDGLILAGAKVMKREFNQPPNNGSVDPQTSLTLDPAVIAPGFANDGQDIPAAGQVASLTSTNNFINFCKTVDLPLTNGKQEPGGSCNPAPMGVIPSKDKMPASKFGFPKNGGTVPANQKFTIEMNIKNLETGNFVNAQQNYFSAPQELNEQGLIKGHSHVVVQLLPAFDSTEILDPEVFAFFKGLNDAAKGGVLSADVTDGLPPGIYRLSSINTASNHQPVLGPIAQHGSLDDAVYFTVA